MRLSVSMVSLFGHTVPGIMQKQKRCIQEYLFRFSLADAMFVSTFSAVAIVPVEAGNPVKVDHVVYYHNIHYCKLMQDETKIKKQAGRPMLAAMLLFILGSIANSAHAADGPFHHFIASLWPEAQQEGVSRATFERETRGLEPDYKLPDLLLPGRPATGAPAQAEFVQVPADYLKEASIARLAAEGQRLLQKYRPALSAIEQRFGVPATVVLAIWGRETDYGRYTLLTIFCACWRRRLGSAGARISIAPSSS